MRSERYGAIGQIQQMRQRLAEVSPSFCLAKWLQVTLHLQNGHNHSCHHPLTHKISREELKENVAALHNTSHKKEMRQLMLRGERPSECDYCWRIEDSASDAISDRHLKSAANWAAPDFEAALAAGGAKNILPRYLEVSFSNTCNFRCAYCVPQISSKWMEEIKKFGPYPTHNRHNNLELLLAKQLMPIAEEKNPYIDAFWRWWPELHPALKVFRITGGEPLLSANTFRVMDEMAAKPFPELQFAINSNLGVPEKQMQTFLQKAKPLLRSGQLRRFEIYTSVDTWGDQAEYIRFGLNFESFRQNVERILSELPGVSLVFMVTYNALSPHRFPELIDWVLQLKRKYTKREDSNPSSVLMDISHLHTPQFLSVKVLPKEHISYVESAARQMQAAALGYDAQAPQVGFFDFEIIKMKRLVDWMRVPFQNKEAYEFHCKNFFMYYEEYDRRRGTSLAMTFPELKEFWEYCRQLPLTWKPQEEGKWIWS